MFSFKDLRIGLRLGLGFGFVLLLLGIIAAQAVLRMAALNATVEEVTQINNPEAKYAKDMAMAIQRVSGAVRDLIILTDEVESKKALEFLTRSRADYDAAEAALGKMFSQFESTTEREKALFAQIRSLKEKVRPLNMRAADLGIANRSEEAAQLFRRDILPLQREWQDRLFELAEFEDQLNVDSAIKARQSFETARNVLVVLSLVAMLLGAGAALWITRTIVGPIKVAVGLAERVADGDLTAEIQVDSKDEAGQLLMAMQRMQSSMSAVVSQVLQGSESVAAASAQIASANTDLSARTESQASSLEETAASMEELNSAVRQNADNAKLANQLAQNASSVATQGGDAVSQVVEAMKSIDEHSRRVNDIISVIDGIAFQTNILALNAAVEAARAGEQGRGFAVVATEVRGLAGRSAEAAKEIRNLITASVQRVEQGSAQVGHAGQTMTEVVTSIRRVTDLMGDISSATEEQSAGVALVGETVNSMDQVTQRNAALVEEMAAAASALKQQAHDLVQTVATFRLSPHSMRGLGAPEHQHPALT